MELGTIIGVLVSLVVGGGIIIAYAFGFDQTPFWLFFNVWQLFMHVPLLNLKIPAFVQTFWREQLKIWTMRNDKVEEWMWGWSQGLAEDRQSYTLELEAAGFNSTQIYVNLGLMLWIPFILVALLPFAWLIDRYITIPDVDSEEEDARRPLTRKPLLQIITNLMCRFALMSLLDVMMCIFICLSTAFNGEYESP